MAGTDPTNPTGSSTGSTVTTSADTPLWYDELSKQFGTQIGSALNTAGGLSSNWYNKPLVAPFSGLQEQAQTAAGAASGKWQPQFNTGWGWMQQGAQDVAGAGTWDPATMTQHVSPYISGVVNEISRLGNQNLMENILPGVNSTFTGAGQFGSTRNADFTNRAIRDTAASIAGAQAGALQNAYTQAANDYLNWNNAQQSAGQALAGIGGQGIGAGATAAGQTWQDISNLGNVGATQQALQQQSLDKAYQDWLSQLTVPTSIMGNLSQMLPQATQLYSKAGTTTVSSPNTGGDLNTALSTISGILSAIPK